MLPTYPFMLTSLMRFALGGFLLIIHLQVPAQDLFDESQLHLTVQKTFTLSSAWRLEVGERIQWNPNLEGIRFLDDPINHPELEEWDFIDQDLLGLTIVPDSLEEEGEEEEEEGDEEQENEEAEEGEDEEEEDDDEEEGEGDDDQRHPIKGAEPIPDPTSSASSFLTDQPHDLGNGSGSRNTPEEEVGPDQDMDPIWQNVRSYTWIRGIYRLDKGCQVALGYQYTLRYQPNSHRVFADFSWRPDWEGEWDFQTRLRIQRDMSFRNDAWQNRNYTRLRNRLRVKLNRSFRLFAQNEWVYRMNRDRYRFDRTIFASGATYRLGKIRWDIRASYQYRFHRKRNPAGLRLSVGMRIHL